jgi:hypothetical protein
MADTLHPTQQGYDKMADIWKTPLLKFLPRGGEVRHRVVLENPDGGEVFLPGESININWTASSAAASFRLKYTLNGGLTWKTIAKGITGTTFAWPAPDVGSTRKKCRVRVEAFDASGARIASDKSDSVFEIRRE